MLLMNHMRWCGLLLVTAFAWGCGAGGPEIASVEGTVTMDGKPLPYASVIFIPPNGRPAGARTDEEGKYVLNFSGGRKGTMPGLNKVRITTMTESYEDEEGNKIPASKELVPMQFNQKSKLEFNVEAGKKNIADFEIESTGQIVQGSSY